MFLKLEGDYAILSQGGVYRAADLATLDHGLFAKFGSGWVRLHMDGSTSRDGVRMVSVRTDAPLYRDPFGRLRTTLRDANDRRVTLVTEGTALCLPKEV